MQFSTLAIAAGAIAGANAATNYVQLTDPSYGGITVGKEFDVTWNQAVGAVSLILVTGDPNNFNTVSTITAGLASPTGSFAWTPDTALQAGNYAIKIQDSVTSNFGALFQLLGATAAPSSGKSSAAATSTVASTSATTTAASSSSAVTSSGSSSASSAAASSTTGTSSGSTTASTSGSSSTAASTTKSAASSKTSSPSSTSTPPATNAAAPLSSSLAMILLGFAAFAFLN